MQGKTNSSVSKADSSGGMRGATSQQQPIAKKPAGNANMLLSWLQYKPSAQKTASAVKQAKPPLAPRPPQPPPFQQTYLRRSMESFIAGETRPILPKPAPAYAQASRLADQDDDNQEDCSLETDKVRNPAKFTLKRHSASSQENCPAPPLKNPLQLADASKAKNSAVVPDPTVNKPQTIQQQQFMISAARSSSSASLPTLASTVVRPPKPLTAAEATEQALIRRHRNGVTEDKDLQESSRPFPELRRLDKIFVSGQPISVPDYLRLLAIYDFFSSYVNLYQEEAGEDDAVEPSLSLEHFESSLVAANGNTEPFFDLLYPFLYQLVSDDLPEITQLNIQGLFALFLSEDEPELSKVFASQEFPSIPLSLRIRALEYLVHELCDHEIFSDHVQSLLDARTDLAQQKSESRKRTFALSTEIAVLEYQCKELKLTVANQSKMFEDYMTQLQEASKAHVRQFSEEMSSNDRMSARQLSHMLKRKREAYIDDYKNEIDMKKAILESIQEELATKTKKLDEFRDEKKAAEEILNSTGTETAALNSVRNAHAKWLGSDRFARNYCFFPQVGAVLVENQDQSEYLLFSADTDFDRVLHALNPNGSRECKLMKTLGSKKKMLLDAVERATEWKTTHLDVTPSELMTGSETGTKILSAGMLSELKEIVTELWQTVETICAHCKREHLHDHIDLDGVERFLDQKAAINVADAADHDALVPIIELLLVPLSNHFFPPRRECRHCSITVDMIPSGEPDLDAIADTPALQQRKASFWKWHRYLHVRKSISSMALFLLHLQEHLSRLVDVLEHRYGSVKANKAVKKTSEMKKRSDRRRSVVQKRSNRATRAANGLQEGEEEDKGRRRNKQESVIKKQSKAMVISEDEEEEEKEEEEDDEDGGRDDLKTRSLRTRKRAVNYKEPRMELFEVAVVERNVTRKTRGRPIDDSESDASVTSDASSTSNESGSDMEVRLPSRRSKVSQQL